MLAPKRIRHRKVQRGSMKGHAKGNTELHFGSYGIQALEAHWITNRQIEACRIAMTRQMKRGGKVWIKIFPDKPITKKPAETRMGSGKGNPEEWGGRRQAGPHHVRDRRRRGCRGSRGPASGPAQAAHQDQDRHPHRAAGRGGSLMKYKDIQELTDEELAKKVEEGRAELFNLASRWPRASSTTRLASRTSRRTSLVSSPSSVPARSQRRTPLTLSRSQECSYGRDH